MTSSREHFRALEVIVGLDFGTSSTKVAYQQLGAPARQVRPMIFDHGLDGYPTYCLPSVITARGGKLLLNIDAARYLETGAFGRGIRRLKVLVAGRVESSFRDTSAEEEFAAALAGLPKHLRDVAPWVFMALTMTFQMRAIRAWLERHFETTDLNLVFNVCAPIDHIENNRVVGEYERVLALAQALDESFRADPDPDPDRVVEAARRIQDEVRYDAQAHATRVYLVPEAVAQVAAYLISLEAREGVHAVIDFGAGTTDVSIFDLADPGNSLRRCYWYNAVNMPLGCARIDRLVAGALEGEGKVPTDGDVQRGVIGLSEQSSLLRGRVEAYLHSIWRASRQVWSGAYGRRRTQSAWEKDDVRIFLCGGGADLPNIARIFSECWCNPSWGPYPVGRLTAPPDFIDPAGIAPFGRLSVAYGLAQPLPDLGDFGAGGDHVLPVDCPDNTPPRPITVDSDNRSQIDQVYPTGGWILFRE